MKTLWSRLVQWLSLMLQWVLGRNTNQLQNGPREIGCRRRRDIKCPKCTKSFGHPTVYTFFSDINIEELLKKKSTDEKIAFKKLFCALLNGQEANLVIFHVTDCRIVDLYDRKVNDILESLIPDGYDYQHKFERRDYDTEHFGVRVKPSKDNESCILSTIDFHTCFSRDKGLNKQPDHMVMQKFLKKAKHDSDPQQILPRKDAFSVNQELLIDRNIPFTENVYRQAKGFEHGANGNESRKEKEKIGEQRAKRSQHAANGNESRKEKEKLGEQQAKKPEHGANGNEIRKEKEKLGEQQAKKSEHGANSNEPRKWKEKLGERQAKRSQHGANGNESRKENEKLGEWQAKQSEHGANCNKPRKWKEKLGERQAKKSEHGANCNESRKENEKLGERQAKQSEQGTNCNEIRKENEKLVEQQAKKSEHGANGNESRKENENLVEQQAKKSEHGAKSNESRKENEKLGERQAKESEHGTNGNEPRKWKEKLKEYISAFSKVPGGGTLYFGVNEETVETHCELTRFICKGVHLNKEQKESWKTFCNEKMKEMLWVAHNQTRSTPGIEVDFIRPKNGHEDCCVIIVRVEQFKGVGFLRRDGPESYELDENDNPTEVKPWAKWARLSRCKDLVVVSTD